MTKYIGPKTDGENVATQADKLSLSSETPDALTPDQTGAAGTATTAARSDHQHEILAAAAGTITGVSNTEGTSTSFARADHTHAISLPRCRALANGTQSLPNASTTPVEFASADDYDTDSFHDPNSNNSRITIPSGLDGVYLITTTILFVGNSTGVRIILLLLNGASTGFGSSAPTFATIGFRLSFATQRNLTAGDYIEVGAYQSSGGSLGIVSGSAFEIVRIG